MFVFQLLLTYSRKSGLLFTDYAKPHWNVLHWILHHLTPTCATCSWLSISLCCRMSHWINYIYKLLAPDHYNGLFVTYCTDDLLVYTVYTILLLLLIAIQNVHIFSHSKQTECTNCDLFDYQPDHWKVHGLVCSVILTWACTVGYVHYYNITTEKCIYV